MQFGKGVVPRPNRSFKAPDNTATLTAQRHPSSWDTAKAELDALVYTKPATDMQALIAQMYALPLRAAEEFVRRSHRANTAIERWHEVIHRVAGPQWPRVRS